jgi:hypothetical protein
VLRSLGISKRWSVWGETAACALLFAVAFAVRSLHAVDLSPVMEGRSQPGVRMASRYDAAAEAILEGQGVFVPEHQDPHDTGLLARPPGYPLVLAAVYAFLGRSFFAVGLVQDLVDSLAAVLVFWLGARLVSPRVGLLASLLFGLGHYSAYYANLVTPDTLCVVPILLAALVLAGRRGRRPGAVVLAGALLGGAVWLRPNAVLLGAFSALVILGLDGVSRENLLRAGTLCLTSLLVVAPITLRNYLLYGRFVPVSINMGIVLWEGIADGGGESFGARGRDYEVAWQEAQDSRNARYAEWWASPDGIDRDRARVRRSLGVILSHPVFFARATLARLWTLVTYRYDEPPFLEAVAPSPFPPPPGAAGFALGLGQALAPVRPAVRLGQEVLALLLVPAYVAGLFVLLSLCPRRVAALLVVPAYVLIFQAPLHLEFRVTLPMHPFVLVLAAAGLLSLAGLVGLARGVARPPRPAELAEARGRGEESS